MQKREFTLQSKYDNLALSCAEYTAEGVTQTNAKGVVQIVHGMCEYKERYEGFIDYLTQNGLSYSRTITEGTAAALRQTKISAISAIKRARLS